MGNVEILPCCPPSFLNNDENSLKPPNCIPLEAAARGAPCLRQSLLGYSVHDENLSIEVIKKYKNKIRRKRLLLFMIIIYFFFR